MDGRGIQPDTGYIWVSQGKRSSAKPPTRLNYLAHIYLSGDSEDILVGNFIGDAVRGKAPKGVSAPVQQGVRLHRKIDAFTDQHPVVAESKARLRPNYRKYAGVVADIYYDHYLAVHWGEYHSEPLPEFAQRVYRLLHERHAELPLKAQHFFHYMAGRDILNAYAKLEGIAEVFAGMASRSSFESGMETAAAFLAEHYAAFEAEFRAFFPDLQAFVRQELAHQP